jgi:hypothetical protein
MYHIIAPKESCQAAHGRVYGNVGGQVGQLSGCGDDGLSDGLASLGSCRTVFGGGRRPRRHSGKCIYMCVLYMHT